MARQVNKIEEDQPAGAPDWMVTFSDCMTLLLTFFVLLLSFATFEDETLPTLGASFAQALPSVGLSQKVESESVYKNERTKFVTKVTKGTETRPPEENISTGMPITQQKPLDFKNVKVFSIDSEKFFYGEGTAISKMGREILAEMAKFLKAKPSRVVISETGAESSDELGLNRAWEIRNNLIEEHQMKKNLFSITSTSMMKEGVSDKRMLSITFLESSIYE